MFTNLFYLRMGNRHIKRYFDLHDDAPNNLDHPFNNMLKSFYSVLLLAFAQEFDPDTSARATKLFYRGRFELVAETSDFLRMLPRRRNIHSETIQQVAAMIKREVNR